MTLKLLHGEGRRPPPPQEGFCISPETYAWWKNAPAADQPPLNLARVYASLRRACGLPAVELVPEEKPKP